MTVSITVQATGSFKIENLQFGASRGEDGEVDKGERLTELDLETRELGTRGREAEDDVSDVVPGSYGDTLEVGAPAEQVGHGLRAGQSVAHQTHVCPQHGVTC